MISKIISTILYTNILKINQIRRGLYVSLMVESMYLWCDSDARKP